MATQAHVYGNGGTGGPVNYATPIATIAAGVFTYNTGAMAEPSVWKFGVRNYDTVSLLEEQNVDAVVTIRVSPTGTDATGIPNAPVSLGATPTAGGGAKVVWAYNTGGQGGRPTNFHVYLGTPSISYTAPVATVAYSASVLAFTTSLSSLTSGATYHVGVRAYNAAGEEANTTVFTFTAMSTGPLPVTNLSASVLG